MCDSIYTSNTHHTFQKLDVHIYNFLRLLKNGQKWDSFAAHFKQNFKYTMSHTDLCKWTKFKVAKQLRPIGVIKKIMNRPYNAAIINSTVFMMFSNFDVTRGLWRHFSHIRVCSLFVVYFFKFSLLFNFLRSHATGDRCEFFGNPHSPQKCPVTPLLLCNHCYLWSILVIYPAAPQPPPSSRVFHMTTKTAAATAAATKNATAPLLTYDQCYCRWIFVIAPTAPQPPPLQRFWNMTTATSVTSSPFAHCT